MEIRMHLREFARAGHWPTLFSAFLYFDVSFMVWVSLGALGNSIASEFQLDPAQRGLMVATPILGGAFLRLALGLLTDYLGARRTGILGLALTCIPLLLGWLWADSFDRILLVGLLLGVAGASFAVALPLASRWYPAEHQGLALGIAGAGNSGTALATFFGPVLAERVGWHAGLGLATIPIVCTLVFFVIFAKDGPRQPAPPTWASYAKVLSLGDTWWFSLFYSVTFGGFVGLASFLNIFFHDQYELSNVQAGQFATLCVIAGSFLRPVGGYLADRLGGIRVLSVLFLAVGFTMLGIARMPQLYVATALVFMGMAFLGMGNGAVFQLVPLRFPKEIGVITGIVGAAGGVGGFLLPNILGRLRFWTGSFGGGFLIFALAAAGCLCVLMLVSKSWKISLTKDSGSTIHSTAEVPA
jgi:NNP family nitrate/nitrite transporter-like MFS transporter